MRISILTYGTRGDVQPFVALGLGLHQAGHQVTIVASASFKSLVQGYGLDFSSMQDEVQPLMNEQEIAKQFESGKNSIQVVRDIFHDMHEAQARMRDDCWAACQSTEVIIDSTPGWGYHIAEKLGAPYVRANCMPYSPTRAFPAPIAPHLPLGEYYNFITFKITEQLAWQPIRQTINHWRQHTLGLPALPFTGPYAHQHQCPHLYAYSPQLIPKPADWPDWFHVTGFWSLPPNPSWQPPAKLLDFLQAGPPPVYVGFGSMTTQRPEALTQIVTQALAKAKQRGILLTGWGGLTHGALSDDVLVIDDVPHTWLFPRMAAVIHHGGSGTAAVALHAGIPSFAVPFIADQPFWGRRIAGLGVGPNPIPLRQLSVDRLAKAIQEVTHNPAMQKRAAEIGQRLSTEDGVAIAIRAFQQHLAPPHLN